MDKNIVISCVKLSALAYTVNPSNKTVDLTTVEPDLVFIKHLYDQSTTTYGFISVNLKTKIIYISFKGTQGLKDFLIDADIHLFNLDLDHKITDVHTGFKDAWESVRTQLESFDFSQYPGFSIYITGHSLGGALATLTCYLLAMPSKPHLCTFGSPKVGDATFAGMCPSVTQESVRIVHYDDMVPMLLGSPYVHVDSCLHLDNNGNVIGTYTLLKNIILWIKGKIPFGIFSVYEHFVTEYEAVLQLWFNKN